VAARWLVVDVGFRGEWRSVEVEVGGLVVVGWFGGFQRDGKGWGVVGWRGGWSADEGRKGRLVGGLEVAQLRTEAGRDGWWVVLRLQVWG
jgi:hypothetical protein